MVFAHFEQSTSGVISIESSSLRGLSHLILPCSHASSQRMSLVPVPKYGVRSGRSALGLSHSSWMCLFVSAFQFHNAERQLQRYLEYCISHIVGVKEEENGLVFLFLSRQRNKASGPDRRSELRCCAWDINGKNCSYAKYCRGNVLSLMESDSRRLYIPIHASILRLIRMYSYGCCVQSWLHIESLHLQYS